MSFTGSCACGAVTATISAEAPVAVRQCWCRQCQQVAGGGAANNAIFPTDSVAITGELATHAYTAASGNILTHSYCPKCGTPVMAQTSARPHFRTMRLGFLNVGHGLAPNAAIWTSDAPPWAAIDPALEQFEGQPPAPPPPPAS
ncbi:aldehyde-activating protein [Novosphingobium sediminis]|uniref:Aldehyde-activating protein n=1 Tax=Novosphingobium sediminis TaxID=707214 RepID=A0A512ALQ8_9SPHN|nr:GFA family protein [Novosphingobium sediminis]GEO00628.1 aldehyde-activating protein [Novosphingobium sediminis]